MYVAHLAQYLHKKHSEQHLYYHQKENGSKSSGYHFHEDFSIKHIYLPGPTLISTPGYTKDSQI